MQVTIGKNAIVYDLGVEERREVAMIGDLRELDSPLVLYSTGFVCNIPKRTMEYNLSYSLGVQRPSKENLSK